MQYGRAVWTRAHLASSDLEQLGSTNMPTVETQPFKPTASTTNKCGTNCGYAIFNNSGAGYTAATTKCVAAVSLPSGPVPNANYALMWRASGTSYDCCQDGPTATQKQFTSTLNAKYVFTAYFKPGFCPPDGTPVTLQVDWQ